MIEQHVTLSPRELMILAALSMGSLYKEIAQQLNISVNTVKKHLKRIYRKLQVRSRDMAVQQFIEIMNPKPTAAQTAGMLAGDVPVT